MTEAGISADLAVSDRAQFAISTAKLKPTKSDDDSYDMSMKAVACFNDKLLTVLKSCKIVGVMTLTDRDQIVLKRKGASNNRQAAGIRIKM